ncbi:hypothetical protein Q3G72_019097 [Acer saccharum]|nr:hypothetical protein Q3G72_019097 [Acer saccharum]
MQFEQNCQIELLIHKRPPEVDITILEELNREQNKQVKKLCDQQEAFKLQPKSMASSLDASSNSQVVVERIEMFGQEQQPENLSEERPTENGLTAVEQQMQGQKRVDQLPPLSQMPSKPQLTTTTTCITKQRADKGEAQSMEFLSEIYARGVGVERNYIKALKWLRLAARQQLYSAYNGMGYLHVKGYGVDKNYTKPSPLTSKIVFMTWLPVKSNLEEIGNRNVMAKEYFEKAAEHEETGGHYNLGVMCYKGIGVKRDVKLACKYFLMAANAGYQKAFYQLAKMFHTGVGLKKNLPMATELYKLVAERGPWSSLSRWALESYLKGDVGKAFLLYSRMAALGYEVAQSNAAWILDKYGEQIMCMGESGLCTDAERHQRALSLWRQDSEQGNEHAALLIGDAYFYGLRSITLDLLGFMLSGVLRGDYERAAEAYMHAKSQANAQAMFDLGYMHEHGQGLPLDLHLAKRYYDQAVEIDPTTKLPVSLNQSCLELCYQASKQGNEYAASRIGDA